jgi:pyrimidine operon attenuation protein / uracil phosphoribosyltransferase
VRLERKDIDDSTSSHARTLFARGVFLARNAVKVRVVSIVIPSRTEILASADVDRAIKRISHEIVERNNRLDQLVIVGMQTGGTWIAERLATGVKQIDPSSTVPLGAVDISMYRDDFSLRPIVLSAPTDIPVDLTEKTVVLVDDVLFTGRTVRAALEALNDHGRPRAVQLAVMVDRGHRELPIRPDYVGKNIPTHFSDEISVGPDGVFVTVVEKGQA